MASKVSLLGQRLRGAQFEVSDLRGNIDRLLQDLEDAVFIFNRDRRLVFASGSVEKFLGRESAPISPASRSPRFSRRPRRWGCCWRRRRRPAGPSATGAFPGGRGRRRGRRSRWCCSRWTCWKRCRADRQSRLRPAGAAARSRRRSARSVANCRPPTACPPSAASPAAWRTR